MVMKKFGVIVANHPKRTVTLLIVLSIIAASIIGIFGIDQEFSESAFMPEHEVLIAQEEVSELFSTTNVHTVSILVRGNNDDVLTSGAMVDILTVGRDVVSDPEVMPTLMNPGIPSMNIQSVAGVVGQSVLAQHGNMNPTMDEMIVALGAMSDEEIKMTVAQLMASEHTPVQVKGMFRMLLTDDFDPVSPAPHAKGSMIIFTLDGSLGIDDSDGMTTEESPLSRSEKRMDAIVRDTQLNSSEMRVMGMTLIMNEIMDASNRNIAFLFPLAFIMVLVILAIVFRNLLEVLICLTALGMGILWMYGFGTALGFSFNPMTIVVPVLMVGLGIDYGIHLTMRHREEAKKGSNLHDAAGNTVHSVGTALLLVTITTAAAFMSNMISPMGPLKEFGIIATIGIICCFFTMVTFVPACLHLRDKRKAKKLSGKKNNKVRKKQNSKWSKRGASGIYRGISLGASSSKKTAMVVIIVVSVISVASVIGAMNLDTTFDFEDFLPEDLDISKDLTFMMDEFSFAGGEAPEVQLLVKGDIADPSVFNAMVETIHRMSEDEYIAQFGDEPDVKWIGNIMKDWATEVPDGFQDGNYNSTFHAMYIDVFTEDGTLSQDASRDDLKGLYNWLYVNPNSHMDTVSVIHMDDNGDHTAAVLRISITLVGTESKEMNRLIDNFDDHKAPLDSTTESAILTGGSVVGVLMLDILNESAMNSLILTLIVCTLIMVLVFYVKDRSVMLGLLTMVPVMFCVLWILGTMYVLGISLNIMTLMVTSLTIGIGVDYGIHISNRFMEDVKKFKTVPDAMYNTVTNTGLALFGGAASTIVGFGLLSLATLPPIAQFGLITALTILYSSLAAVYLLPTFLVVWANWKKKRN